MLIRFPFETRLNSLICFADGDPPPVPPGGSDNPPPADTPPPTNNAATDTPAGDTPPPAPPPAPVADWRDKQINRQHAKIKALEGEAGRAGELAAENERLKQLLEAKSGTTTPPAPVQTAVAPQTTVSAPSAGDPKAQARFEIELENIKTKIDTDYAKDWPEAEENFRKAGGIPTAIMQDILATDDAAYVTVQLGKNPGRFQEILDLPEARRRNALFKMAQEHAGAVPAARPRPSNAPEPPAPLPRGGVNLPPAGTIVPDRDDRVPIPEEGMPRPNKYGSSQYDDAWYAERARQKRESTGKPWSVGGRAGGR